MCLTIPGKIIKIEEDIATLDYGSEKRQVKIVEGNYKVGDFVLVQARVIVEKVPERQMKGWLEVLKDIQSRQED